ncbi:RagB/SusD family nutrient uptake outer membrane protein [Flavobacterium sp. MC2016-06]|uniref:RagB/SusD family nutrient uptake outer membrane protein n=1 Tax=Flavobacterium sp. MC2016-06 TaxID=2676308 RepID=UPI0012BA7142|nr:RagB/SusD family nutrient uptake outer membrane protein [Flavobacterium sp. MC2016-06]MBU3858813.1 RagB/SusD family nutrient uptake outer membrane protein [Flavobacterium sp. MC2016-06]
MKTKFSIYIGLSLLFVLGTSCSDDFLKDKKNYGSYDDTFYQSQERTQAYVDNQYYDFYNAYKSPTSSVVGLYTDANTKLTEELGGTQDLINPNKTIVNAADANAYYGLKIGTGINNTPYNRIRECNNLLEDIDVKGASLDKTFRDQAKGQMYYMRAMQYYDLMRTYGGVPIVTTVQDAAADNPDIQLPRAKVSEVVDQIVKDLDMAASLLPGNWNSANYGRFTKGAALAQKSRVLLTFASPLFNKNWDGSTERWEAALKAGLAAEAQLSQDGYGLFGNSIKQWDSMFLTDNLFCSEAITVQLCGTGITSNVVNNSWEKGIRLASQGGVSGGATAPKEMIDLFPMADGSRPTAANGYNDFTFFVNRDPRFYRTFAFSGEKWGYKENANAVLWTYRWVDAANKIGYADGNNAVSSPAFVRKMTNTAASNATNYQYSGTDIFEYRYAELLLNIAECYAALGQTNNTLAYLGRIRNRVGIPAANNYGIGTLADKYAAIEACLYERRVELAYEGKRYWDIQRWKLYSDDALGTNVSNSCQKLGLAPINGTQRTGNYLQYKNTAASSATDPLAAARATLVADPDAANFQTQLATLATFYNTNFTRTALVTPLDNFNGVGVKIKFNPNYYISGLNTTALTQNPWLLQTIGWNDVSGAPGTYNYQE